MAVIVLSFIGSDDQISSGIPRTMSIESNIPTTIYFTTSGTEPTFDSPIYTGTFDMPDNVNSVILSAFGVDGDGNISSVLTQVFGPDVSLLNSSRMIGQEGFILDRYGQGEDTPVNYDADGNTARFIDVDLETLDVIKSETGANGIGEGTVVQVTIPSPSQTPSFLDDGLVVSSTPEIGELFNPYARTITIDNRKNNDILLTMRTYGCMRNIYGEFGAKDVRTSWEDRSYVSGGFLRRYYDARNNVMVSYYMDHNEPRHAKNIQTIPDGIINSGYVGQRQSSGQPLVFKWVRGNRSSI